MNLKNNIFISVEVRELIEAALREDINTVDITTKLLIPRDRKARAVIVLKERAVIAGIAAAQNIFRRVDKNIEFRPKCAEGSYQPKGQIICVLEGEAGSILSAERTALNFLSHLSGIATITDKFVQKVKPGKVKIMDTRKTIPGLRSLQKYAVRAGGGYNHRFGLGDGILIKDNHIALGVLRHESCVMSPASCIKALVEIAKRKKPKDMKIEIEVKNLSEFKEALEAHPDIIMLDNMRLGDIRKAVTLRRTTHDARRTTQLEVSGGVNLDNVRKIAMTGVDIISIGALTHSARAIDMSLEIIA